MNHSVFLHIAVEVDRRPAFLPASRAKKQLIQRCKVRCLDFLELPGTISADVFDAVFVPPGGGAYLKEREGCVRVARYDMVILVECRDGDAARAVMRHRSYAELLHILDASARFTHKVKATTAAGIGPVDTSRPGVFLFNYFIAETRAQDLEAWRKAAGWLQDRAGLDNATVLVPLPGSRSQYSMITHSRWNRLRDIVPWLVFRTSFRDFVFRTFAAQRVAAMPVLYRLA